MKLTNRLFAAVLAGTALLGIFVASSCDKKSEDSQFDAKGTWVFSKMETQGLGQMPFPLNDGSAKIGEVMAGAIKIGEQMEGFNELVKILTAHDLKLDTIAVVTGNVLGKIGLIQLKLNADGTLEMLHVPGVSTNPKGTWRAEGGKVMITLENIPIPEGDDAYAVAILNQIFSNGEVVLEVKDHLLVHWVDGPEFTQKMMDRYKDGDRDKILYHTVWKGLSKMATKRVEFTFKRIG